MGLTLNDPQKWWLSCRWQSWAWPAVQSAEFYGRNPPCCRSTCWVYWKREAAWSVGPRPQENKVEDETVQKTPTDDDNIIWCQWEAVEVEWEVRFLQQWHFLVTFTESPPLNIWFHFRSSSLLLTRPAMLQGQSPPADLKWTEYHRIPYWHTKSWFMIIITLLF